MRLALVLILLFVFQFFIYNMDLINKLLNKCLYYLKFDRRNIRKFIHILSEDIETVFDGLL